MDTGTLDQTTLTTTTNPKAPNRKEVEILIYVKMREATKILERIINDAV